MLLLTLPRKSDIIKKLVNNKLNSHEKLAQQRKYDPCSQGRTENIQREAAIQICAAEDTYAQFVREHPEWKQQPVKYENVKEHGELPTWTDVFRCIGLSDAAIIKKR